MGKLDTPSTVPFQRYGHAAARFMIAMIFLVSGWDKLANTEDAIVDISEVGLPAPAVLAIAAGVLEILCGALLALGWQAAWAAAGLLVFMVPVTVIFESPLRGDGEFGALIDFLKNLAIMGGLLLVMLTELSRTED